MSFETSFAKFSLFVFESVYIDVDEHTKDFIEHSCYKTAMGEFWEALESVTEIHYADNS